VNLRRLTTGLVLSAVSAVAAGHDHPPQQERKQRPCAECHGDISVAFGATRMASAATGAEFLAEWQGRGRPAYCRDCHAPGGGKGLVCADCHGTGPHPYPQLQVPGVCARCHDAPGESTTRRFRESRSAHEGKDCLDCHLPGDGPGSDHRFAGSSEPGFLEDVAALRLILRTEPDGDRTAVVQVSHRAGHALPGGTTGRSVWLIVQGIDVREREVWREVVRFGWEHRPDGGWLDRTLLPDRSAVLEIPDPGRDGSERLRAELRYRFRPGPLELVDPGEVTLDLAELEIPRREREGRSDSGT
jgi:hypothetical protein